jgi:hypothetical protein
MEPGRASNTPPPFPAGWCGLWKDPLGKVMYIQHAHGRHLLVSFTAGIQESFFPLTTSPIGITRHLPGIYMIDSYGVPVLQIDIGDPQNGTRYDIHFIFGEGDRLRTAESWDMVSGLSIEQLLEGRGRGNALQGVSRLVRTPDAHRRSSCAVGRSRCSMKNYRTPLPVCMHSIEPLYCTYEKGNVVFVDCASDRLASLQTRGIAACGKGHRGL